MTNHLAIKISSSQPTAYQIRIQGHLSREWTDWFGGMTIALDENGETLLTCPVIDQAALYGLLKKVRDLGMPLVALYRVHPDMTNAAVGEPDKEKNESNCV